MTYVQLGILAGCLRLICGFDKNKEKGAQILTNQIVLKNEF
jgi:hypothetical protein